MFGEIKKGLRGSKSKDNEEEVSASEAPFSFDTNASNAPYNYPSLYQEADEMLQVALLIYTMTDLRSLAKRKKSNLQNPEKVLTLPLSLPACLEMIQDNLEEIKKQVGDSDHEMTMSALQSILERYESQALTPSGHWANPYSGDTGFDVSLAPQLIAYGDEKPDSDLVYAVGMDPIRKRVTVAFRGSVTTSDFMTDAGITLNRQESPLADADDEKIGIHSGFYDYLLKERKGGESKYTEIIKILQELFEDPERQSTYKLYVTGHSLGGALATLFSFYVAADPNNDIPKPVTCVSVASPRVGEATFQRDFSRLEKQGQLRHLRIANDGDPVTIMPKSSSKKLWAMLSPASYIAFKFSDKDFEEKETYKHTGMKLKLKKEGQYEIAYSGVQKEEDATSSPNKSTSKLSFRQKDLPDVVNHFGNVYAENLASVKDDLAGMTLNDLYQSNAATGQEADVEDDDEKTE